MLKGSGSKLKKVSKLEDPLYPSIIRASGNIPLVEKLNLTIALLLADLVKLRKQLKHKQRFSSLKSLLA